MVAIAFQATHKYTKVYSANIFRISIQNIYSQYIIKISESLLTLVNTLTTHYSLLTTHIYTYKKKMFVV
jgi:hypothetical protein